MGPATLRGATALHRLHRGRHPPDLFDHALIISLGCASVLNLPVVHDGRTLGVLTLLHEARWYGEDDVPLGQVFAALAVPAFRLLSG
ncbi:MAG TPA: GAF domain-containing protein [Methylomirabilota bacterium]|nr:GAF domain-containing protein [Methylomirabilota bacterium]